MATQNKIVSSLYLISKLAGVKLIEGAMLRISPSTLALLPLRGSLGIPKETGLAIVLVSPLTLLQLGLPLFGCAIY